MKPSDLSKPLSILGLMTGSSADGLDLCWASFWEKAGKTNFSVLYSATIDYPPLFKTSFSNPLKLSKPDIIDLDLKLGKWLSESVATFQIPFDAIASHGQTIKHEPPVFSLQIGDPTFMAKRFQKPVITDFRNADIKLGGQGAPLIPITDLLMFQQESEAVLALNIGGISNLTVVPARIQSQPTLAWDCGPGNTLIDKAVKAFTRGQSNFDRDGIIAAKGKLDRPLLDFLLGHEFYDLAPPRSAGQEQFGHTYFSELLKHSSNPLKEADQDVIHTLTVLSASCVANSVRRVSASYQPKTIFMAGGGIKNKALVTMIQDLLPEIKLKTFNINGVHPDNKEAFGFAYLGYLRLLERAGNIPSVTGARAETVLGQICDPT